METFLGDWPHRLQSLRDKVLWARQLLIFVIFLLAARSAAAPAVDARWWQYEAAKVTVTVTSQIMQIMHLPALHVMRVQPSSHFPSDLDRPGGSFDDGKPVFISEWHKMSLRAVCRVIWAGPSWQEGLWWPYRSTKVPQGQLCSIHCVAPSRSPVTTFTDSFSSLRPLLLIGRMKSQSPEYGDVTAFNLALSISLAWLENKLESFFAISGLSHFD